MKAKIYHTDSSHFDDYVKSTLRKRITQSFSIALIVLVLLGFTIFQIEQNWGILWVVFIVAGALFGSFFWSGSRLKANLLRFKSAQYRITNSSIKMENQVTGNREVHLKKLAIFHSNSMGLILMEGTIWTKIDFYRPKVSSVNLDEENVLFIPKALEHFQELKESLEFMRKNPSSNA